MRALVVWGETCLEVIGGLPIAQLLEVRDLTGRPRVQGDGTNLRYMRAQFAVNAAAGHTNEDAEIC